MEDSAVAAPEGLIARLRARAAAATAFTLIELVVTMAVITVGVVATHRVFLETLDATASANARTRASAIATREVERVQAIPYGEVGLPTGSAASFEGADTVIVDPSAIAPTGSESIDGEVFSITRWVVWEAGSSAYPDAIKRVVAIVDWTDQAGPQQVRADAAVYPGGLGPYSGTATTTTTAGTTPGTPTDLVATTNATDSLNQIDLSWTPTSPLPEHWEIQLSTDAGTTWITDTDTHPGAYSTFSATGLAAGTTYHFRLRGRSAPGNSGWSNLASAATVDTADACDVQSAIADPGTVRKKNPDSLFDDVELRVNTAGECTTLLATFETSPGANKSITFNKSGDVYQYTIWRNAYSDWSTGNKIIRVLDSSNNELAQISLQVTN